MRQIGMFGATEWRPMLIFSEANNAKPFSRPIRPC